MKTSSPFMRMPILRSDRLHNFECFNGCELAVSLTGNYPQLGRWFLVIFILCLNTVTYAQDYVEKGSISVGEQKFSYQKKNHDSTAEYRIVSSVTGQTMWSKTVTLRSLPYATTIDLLEHSQITALKHSDDAFYALFSTNIGYFWVKTNHHDASKADTVFEQYIPESLIESWSQRMGISLTETGEIAVLLKNGSASIYSRDAQGNLYKNQKMIEAGDGIESNDDAAAKDSGDAQSKADETTATVSATLPPTGTAPDAHSSSLAQPPVVTKPGVPLSSPPASKVEEPETKPATGHIPWLGYCCGTVLVAAMLALVVYRRSRK